MIDFPRLTREPALILSAIGIVFVSRAVLVTAVFRNFRFRLTRFSPGARCIAARAAATVGHRAEILDAVFATVFVTLVLQGLPLQSVISHLYPPIRDLPGLILEA